MPDDPVQTAEQNSAASVDNRSTFGGPSNLVIQPADQLRRLRRQYGPEFPGLDGTGPEWRQWLDAQMRRQEPIMRDKRLHWMRHRYFRNGWQWITSRDGRTWKEPMMDENDIRLVLNLIGPALDFRLSILTEQRPGFRAEGQRSNSAAREWAEAQQLLTEYYYFKNQMWEVFRDAWYQAQTDGTAWIHVFVDKFAGPVAEDVELVPPSDTRFASLLTEGYEQDPQDGLIHLPYDDSGDIAPPGTPINTYHQGDLASRVVLARETYADPEARTINGPNDRARWFVIRRVRDVKLARLETGNDDLEAEVVSPQSPDSLDRAPDAQFGWQRGLPPYPSQLAPRRTLIKEAVYEFLMYLAPTDDLPEGAWRRIIGTEIVDGDDELPGRVIPVARITDGSADPDLYPRPVVSDWIGDQLAINAIASMIMKTIRIFGGGRLMAPKGSLLGETYSKIVGSIVEYTGQPPTPGPQPPAGMDAWKMLDWMVKKLEDKHGWNDVARGQLSGSGSFQDVSGRALLGARELFERSFGPMVRAAAQGATEWAHVMVRYAQWLFDEPRLIPAVGGSPRLAMRISRESLGDELLVYTDPETLMPLPRAQRNQMLFDMYQNQMITLDEYRRRAPFADIRDVYMGGTEQYDRAQWINTLLEEKWQQLLPLAQPSPPPPGSLPGTPPGIPRLYDPKLGMPILWQDDPAVHKAALLDIILDERKPVGLRTLAWERWGIYDQLQRSQMPPPPPTPGPNGIMIPAQPVPVPPVVTGVPQHQPGAVPPVPIAPAPAPPAISNAPHAPPKGGHLPGQIATSPAPTTSPTTPTAASQLKPRPIGEFGNAER